MDRKFFVLALVCLGSICTVGRLQADPRFGADPFMEHFDALHRMVVDADEASYRDLAHRREREAHLDAAIEILRVPDAAAPSGFRYLRPREKGVYVDLVQADVSTLYTDGALHTLTGRCEGTDEVNFYCPSKRSLSRGNRDVFVKAYTVTWDEPTGRRALSRTVDQWLKRGTNLSVQLGAWRRNVEVQVWLGTKASHLGKALIRVQVAEPVYEDDPANPNYDLLRDLLDAQELVSSSLRRDELRARLDAIRSRLHEGRLARLHDPAGPQYQVMRRLEFVLYLLDGVPAERERGRTELRRLVEEMRAGRLVVEGRFAPSYGARALPSPVSPVSAPPAHDRPWQPVRYYASPLTGEGANPPPAAPSAR